jgi:hypothetical protein
MPAIYANSSKYEEESWATKVALLIGMVSFDILLSKDSLNGVTVLVLYVVLGCVTIGTKRGVKNKISSDAAISFCIPAFKVGTPISECETHQNVTYSVFSCGCLWKMPDKMRNGTGI